MYAGLLSFMAFILWGVAGIVWTIQPAPGARTPPLPNLRYVDFQVPPDLDDQQIADRIQAGRQRPNRQNFSGMLTSVHIAHGLWHENPIFNFWGVLVLLTSLGLFALGGTGIYLWFKAHDERVIGGALFLLGLSYAFVTMCLVRTQG